MPKKKMIDIKRYESIGLSLFFIKCHNIDRLIYDMFHGIMTLTAVVSEIDRHIFDDMKAIAEGRISNIEKFPVNQSRDLNQKYNFQLLYTTIKGIEPAFLKCARLVEHQTDCYFFVSEGTNEQIPNSNMIDQVFSESGWMKTGEPWITWVAKVIHSLPCEYLLVPDFESPYVHIGVDINKEEVVLEKIQHFINNSQVNQGELGTRCTGPASLLP